MTNARHSLDETTVERDAERERSSRLAREKEQLGNGATPQELDDLRRARVQATMRGHLLRSLEDRLRDLVQARSADVSVRKGRMVVRFGDALLFDAATGALAPAGQAALRSLAAILREIPDRDFLVVGHTDNQALRGRTNWDATAAHAIAVVRFLQGEGVDPRRLQAGAASEFDALAPNDSAEQRALNRRVEVVLLPTAAELPAIAPPPPGVAPPPTIAPAPAPAPPAAATPPRPAPLLR